jgi:hypothetical protein
MLDWISNNDGHTPSAQRDEHGVSCWVGNGDVGNDGGKEKMTTAQKGIVLFGVGLLIFFVGASSSSIAAVIGGLMSAVGAFVWGLNIDYNS